MDRESLRVLLAEGLALAEIGRRYGKDASTVGYWVRKHGLEANGRAKYAPRGGVARARLEPLVGDGQPIRAIAEELGLSISTVRHWMRRYGLETPRIKRIAATRAAVQEGATSATFECIHHGRTTFRLIPSKGYRCARCASEAVSRRRRKVKETLVREAGGRCRLCGYGRYVGALHFHHVEPGTKAFGVSRGGNTRSLAAARTEALKCVLLCSNCHAELEAGIVSLR